MPRRRRALRARIRSIAASFPRVRPGTEVAHHLPQIGQLISRRRCMKRVVGFALAALVALPLAASAEEVAGKIKTIDRTDNAFVLEDGTRLWVDEGRLAGLREGEKVLATYSTKDGKKVV